MSRSRTRRQTAGRFGRMIPVIGMLAGLPVAAGLAQSRPPEDAPAQAAEPAPPAASFAPTNALLEQGYYWASRDPKQAIDSLRRLLLLQPDQPSALALLAETAALQDQATVANDALTRLQAAHPGDPRIPAVQAAIRIGSVDASALKQARTLADSGHAAEALAAYKRAFKGGVPPDVYAAEFYSTLQSTDKFGSDNCCAHVAEAWQGLAAVAKRYPGIASLALDAARLMSYDEGARPDAINQFAALAKDPLVGEAARRTWRQVLLWQGPNFTAQDELEAYLSIYPSDPQLEAKREEFRRSLPSKANRDRMVGYEALGNNDVQEAEKQFQAAMAASPQDPDNLVAMAILREYQHRLDDARKLLVQAIALAPDRKDDFVQRTGLSEDEAAERRAGEDAVRRQYDEIKRLTDVGHYAAAQALLMKVKGKQPSAGFYVELGSIQLRAGDTNAAEASFRQALAMHPGDPAASQALAQMHTSRLLAKAKATHDAAEKERMLRAAIDGDGADPWLCLKLASLLADRHDYGDADGVMANVAAGPKPTANEIQAALFWADRRNDLGRAERLLPLLPPSKRTPSIQQLAQRVAISNAIHEALAMPDPDARRRRLLDVAAERPDPTGARGVAVANELLRIGDRAAVRQAIAGALGATPRPTSEQRLAYLGPLMRSGAQGDVQRLAEAVDPSSLPAPERAGYHAVMDGLAITRADRLTMDGKAEQAFNTLEPRLRADPDNTDLHLATARIYQAQGQAETALKIDREALGRDPGNLDAQRSTVNAAIVAGDIRLAERIAAAAIKDAPDDPRSHLMSAAVADARGDKGAALKSLLTARALHTQQLAASADGQTASP